ncbi:hypothetical protein EDC04DRAFT_2684780 [Pisolithus marmoratus]|nr:hypothetical protein EDC04DRAFT_2684780 [Pisolithus marmoratus]
MPKLMALGVPFLPLLTHMNYNPPLGFHLLHPHSTSHGLSLHARTIFVQSLCRIPNCHPGIRAQNIPSGVRRIPAGFYVVIQFDGKQRRTQNKPIRMNESNIEWEDKILLPLRAADNVRFTVYASFELEPMLGMGEALYTSEHRAEELVGGTYLITHPPGEFGTAAPSLLVTQGRWYSYCPAVALSEGESDSAWEESSDVVRETDLGQEALLRYCNEYRKEELENAVEHFEYARDKCPWGHRCRAVVLVNLARAKFINHRTDPTTTNLDESISLYREALDLRPAGHLDRPATLLQLAQTLLFRYENQGCDESVADEINKLMIESQDCSEDTHERRAADLVLETLERCRVVNSGSLAELSELVLRLEHSAMVPPDRYFDRPQRLINLSTTLWRRHEKHGELGDLDRALEINKQALRSLPPLDPDRLSGLRTLSDALRKSVEIHRDFSYLREVNMLHEEALQLIPEGHPAWPYWVTNSRSHRGEMLEYLGDTDTALVTK